LLEPCTHMNFHCSSITTAHSRFLKSAFVRYKQNKDLLHTILLIKHYAGDESLMKREAIQIPLSYVLFPNPRSYLAFSASFSMCYHEERALHALAFGPFCLHCLHYSSVPQNLFLHSNNFHSADSCLPNSIRFPCISAPAATVDS